MTETWEGRLAELVKAALERNANDWPAFLREACPHDETLRMEAESLLRARGFADCILEQPAIHLGAHVMLESEAFQPGERLDHYKMCALLGVGGMGEVYLAEDSLLGRKVALKLIRQGFGHTDFIRRFQAEEKILGGLTHPNIAHLYGAGLAPSGVPYFVMEYVEGERLDQYCDQRGLTTNERLEIFRKICAAVNYAHQHLVIHRDLKPANIRVTPEGEPKLLDFGIARLLDSEVLPEMEPAVTLDRAMTPDYASPEQMRGESVTIYSLGVLLCELLTGEPFDRKVGRPALGGDLESIASLAMRNAPAQRYASVALFSEDIRRYLDGLTVIARKSSLRYRATKFVGRNKISVAAIVVVAIALCVGTVATFLQARRANRQRDRAETRFREIHALAYSLLFEVMPKLDFLPGANAGLEILVRRAVEYFDSLAREAGDDPAFQREMALAYRALAEQIQNTTGDHATAVANYRKALVLDEILVAKDPDSEEACDELAREYEKIGWAVWHGGDTGSALGFYQKALRLREPLAASNPQSFDFNYRLAHLHLTCGDLCNRDDESEEALQNYQQAMAKLESLGKTQAPNVRSQRAIVYCHTGIAAALGSTGRLLEAVQECDAALGLLGSMIAVAPDDLSLRDLMVNAFFTEADIYRKQKDYPRALATIRKCIGLTESTIKEEPHDANARAQLAKAESDLADVSRESGDPARAILDLQKAIAIQESLLSGGAQNFDYAADLAQSYERLAQAQLEQPDFSAAVESCRKALPWREQNAKDEKSAGAQTELALCLQEIGLIEGNLAVAEDVSREQRSVGGHNARTFFERSREILARLHQRYPKRDRITAKLKEVSEQLMKMDETLARL